MNIQKALKFFAVAEAMASFSKDPSTKVGSLALDDDYNILSLGYNGFCRNMSDSADRFEREFKLTATVHAEANVVAQAARKGVSLKGSTVLVTPPYSPAATAPQFWYNRGLRES